ncbi:MAG: DUF188 domain-containing protein [Treponema sp.]|jgi:uncharacterized protein YaiI (UPF0178 family)|nr:DUF188 domain-containing protein [Treponema sp.]
MPRVSAVPGPVKILVDADSCPRPAREIVLRYANRTGIRALFAANRPIPGIAGENAAMELCPPGEGSADNRIVELARPGDLVLTRDVPLAERLAENGVTVLDDRGRSYTKENIRELCSLRDFMVGLAENGLGTERTAAYGRKELKTFADSLDRELTRLRRKDEKI